MVKEFKGCTIQSYEHIDTTIDSGEHVDARNSLRNDSAEQVDAISDSENWLWMEVIQKTIQL